MGPLLLMLRPILAFYMAHNLEEEQAKPYYYYFNTSYKKLSSCSQ
jgi:hypothetical protein